MFDKALPDDAAGPGDDSDFVVHLDAPRVSHRTNIRAPIAHGTELWLQSSILYSKIINSFLDGSNGDMT
jgi:hypothetical protein